MILDTSAIVAVALQEPEHERLLDRMAAGEALGVGAPTLTETGIVLSARLDEDARGLLSRFLLEGSVEAVAFTDAHFGAAVGAWLRYGRGRHPAGLNFGDCLSYATAKLAGRPLLCRGEDFSKTDLQLALRSEPVGGPPQARPPQARELGAPGEGYGGGDLE